MLDLCYILCNKVTMNVTTTKKQKKKAHENIKEWGKVPTIAHYADLSPRTIRNLIKAGEIRYTKLPTGTILIKLAWIDEYLESKAITDNQLDLITKDILSDFKI